MRPRFRLGGVVLTGCLLAACSPPSDSSLEPGIAEADSIVGAWVDQQRIPGAVLLVSRGGEVVHERAHGFASFNGERVPMRPETVFDLASVTKVMATTFAVMLLVDRGELDLDAPAQRYLPDFMGGGKEAVTLRHLLTHRSGLYQWQPTYYHAANSEEAYAFIRDLPLNWPVGEGRHYSDLGFMLLGRIVEQVSGRPLEVFVAEELYAPLGLPHTGFRRTSGLTETESSDDATGIAGVFAATSHGNPFERRMVHDPDFGYDIEGDPDAWDGWRTDWLEGEVNDGNAFHSFESVAGHAGLFSTAGELNVLLQTLLNGGVSTTGRVVGTEIVEAFLTSTGDGQALGWQLPSYAPDGSFGHTGFTGTFVLGVPGQDVAIVLLTNRQNFGVDEGTEYPDVGPLQRAVTTAITGLD